MTRQRVPLPEVLLAKANVLSIILEASSGNAKYSDILRMWEGILSALSLSWFNIAMASVAEGVATGFMNMMYSVKQLRNSPTLLDRLTIRGILLNDQLKTELWNLVVTLDQERTFEINVIYACFADLRTGSSFRNKQQVPNGVLPFEVHVFVPWSSSHACTIILLMARDPTTNGCRTRVLVGMV